VTDETTLGGYLIKHQRPPAFGGPDGRAYSVAVMLSDEPDTDGRFGAALLFVRWSEAGDAPDGHVETGYVAFGGSREEAERAAQALSLHDVKGHLDRAVEARQREPDW
jgi:hypothetical protein